MFSLSSLFGGDAPAGPPESSDPHVLYGVQLLGGGITLAGVKAQLDRLFEVRVAKLDGVPSDWLIRVRELQTANPGNIVTIAPSRMGNTAQTPSVNRAYFLDTTEKCDAWMIVYRRANELISSYAANPDPGWLSQFAAWIGNDEVWAEVGAAMAAPGHAIAAATVATASAVGDVASAVYQEEKQGISAAATWFNDSLNPFTLFGKFSAKITAIVISIVVVVALFFLWRSGLLSAAAQAIPSSKKAGKRAAKASP